MDRTQDRQLIARLQAGDEAAVQELAERYGPRIYQLALRHMKNREDAEEVTQDVLLKVYRKIDAFRGDAALSSWIYRITFNTAMSRLRQHRAARAAEQERDRALALLEDGRAAAHAAASRPTGRGCRTSTLLRRAAARGGGGGDARAARDLPRAGRAARHRRADDRRSEQPAEGEGSDAEVASAPRAADAARAARVFTQRPRDCIARRRPYS